MKILKHQLITVKVIDVRQKVKIGQLSYVAFAETALIRKHKFELSFPLKKTMNFLEHTKYFRRNFLKSNSNSMRKASSAEMAVTYLIF